VRDTRRAASRCTASICHCRQASLVTGRKMNSPSRNARAVIAALSLPLLLLAACSRASESGPPTLRIGYCGYKPQVRPEIIVVTCSNDSITAIHLTWSEWGKPKATAKGSATIDLCAYAYMDCAQGDYESVPIVVFASRIKKCSRNAHAYSTLRYTFPHGSPWGQPSKYAAKHQWIPKNQLPPANQTVSLTC
jgi:hypothetical protein